MANWRVTPSGDGGWYIEDDGGDHVWTACHLRSEELVGLTRDCLAALPEAERRSLFRDAADELIAKDDLMMLVSALLDAMSPADRLKMLLQVEEVRGLAEALVRVVSALRQPTESKTTIASYIEAASRVFREVLPRIEAVLTPWLGAMR